MKEIPKMLYTLSSNWLTGTRIGMIVYSLLFILACIVILPVLMVVVLWDEIKSTWKGPTYKNKELYRLSKKAWAATLLRDKEMENGVREELKELYWKVERRKNTL